MTIFATPKYRETFLAPLEATRDRSDDGPRRRSSFVPVSTRRTSIVAVVAGVAMLVNLAAAVAFAAGVGQ